MKVRASWIAILPLGISVFSLIPEVASAAELSEKIRQIFPDIKERLASPEWTKREEIFDLLVVQPKDAKGQEFEFLYELPPSDYEEVLTRVFEGLAPGINETLWPQISQSMPVWIDVIQRLKLESATAELAALTRSKDMISQMLALQMLQALDARKYGNEIAALLDSSHSEIHRPALDALIKFKSKLAVPSLLKNLSAPQLNKRITAIHALEAIADPAAVTALTAMADDPVENLRFAAIKAVEAIVPEPEKDKILIPMARRIVEDSKDPHLVSYALAVLVDRGVAEAAPEVIRRLSMSDDILQFSMRDALGLLTYIWKKPRSIDVLAPLAAKILMEPEMHSSAQESNKRIGMVIVLACATTPESIEPLRVAATGANVYVQRSAIAALGRRGARSAVPDLISLLKTSPRCDADRALALIRDRRAIDPLDAFFEKNPQAIDNFVYGFNESYDRAFDRVMEITVLKKTIKGRPDLILDDVSKESGIPIVWHDRPPTTAMESVEFTASYERENLKTAIGRPLYYLNRGRDDPYVKIWKDQEVHLIRRSAAPVLLREIFEGDFQ